MKKIYVLCYHSIASKRSSSPMATAIYQAALACPENCIFYFNSIDDNTRTNIRQLPIWFKILYKFQVLLGKRLFPDNLRTVSELMVDRYYAKVINKEKGDYKLLVFFYAPKSAEIAQKNGKEVILLAGNHDDNLYYKVIKEEMKRTGLQSDPYVNHFRNRYYNILMENVNTVVSPHQLVLDLYPSKFNKVKVESYYVPFGYQPKQSYQLNDTVKIGYIGHTTTLLKGLHLLAQAISRSSNKIQLVVAGDVSSSIRKMISDTGVDVKYLGFLGTQEKNKFYNEMDLLVVPSLYDAAPTTASEALECGLPLLLSDGCGNKEHFEKYANYFIFKTGDVVDMSVKIDYAIEHYDDIVRATKELKNVYFSEKKNYVSFSEYFKLLAE